MKEQHPLRRCAALMTMCLLCPLLVAAQTSPFRDVIVKTRHPLRALARGADGQIRTGFPLLDQLCASLQVNTLAPTFGAPAPPRNREARRTIGLDRIYQLRLPVDRVEEFIAALANEPEVEYVHVNHSYRIHYVPNDPHFPAQWALKRIQASAAWDINRGDRAILIAIIDTGIDHRHEDLAANIWINAGEDLNANGAADSSDYNGIDDDGNGFVDDIQGWDFTDAPYFADGGDYLTRDNDPFDENGHGTAVAGIVGAVADNNVGVVGLAHGCRLMNLRAGTSSGLLEEDDVASALAYAADNGARVVNMSFGDIVCTPLLRDAVAYAHACGVLLVASAGNSANTQIHYPSALDEVVAVGATDSTDYLAGFSNYGPTLDVVAPGTGIWTTALNNGYTSFSGTSAAAPFVSALAALIFSQHPDYSSDNVRGTLLATADDLGSIGWDHYYAAGRINACAALRSPNFTVVRIAWPRLDRGAAGGSIPIIGTAAGVFMRSYELSYGTGVDPEEWHPFLKVHGRQVIDDTLGVWDVSALPDTQYMVRVTAENADGSTVSQALRVFIDRTPPRISAITQTPMIEEDFLGCLVSFLTDELCDAQLQCVLPSGASKLVRLAYQTAEHRVFLTPQMVPPGTLFRIEATNRSQLAAVDDNGGRFYPLSLEDTPVSTVEMELLPTSLPPVYLFPQPADLDGDGRDELVTCRYNGTNIFGKLTVWRNVDGVMVPVWESREPAIPRSIGDTDGDGLREILAGYGGRTILFEQTAPHALAFQVVWWSDNDTWGARLVDFDGDARSDLIVRKGATYQVWRSLGGHAFALWDSLPNPTGGSNITGVPHVEVADFDRDGRLEVLVGDYDGDVYLYECEALNGRFRMIWSERLPLMDTIDFLGSGDYDGDGQQEFVVGCHSDPSLDAEHEYDARHWLYRVYKATGNDMYAPQKEWRFFGFSLPKDFDAGVSAGDVDNDGRAEILVNVFPDFYILKWDEVTGTYSSVWHYRPNRSNAAVVADTDGDGVREVFFNDGHSTLAFRCVQAQGRPAAPKNVDAFPLDTSRAVVSWKSVEKVQGYWVRFGEHADSLSLKRWVAAPPCTLRDLTKDHAYWIAVSSVDSSGQPPESLPSRLVMVTPNAPPRLESAQALNETSVRLRFSEPMDDSVKDPARYTVLGYPYPISSVLHDKSGQEVIMTLPSALPSGDTLVVRVCAVSDSKRTPIDTMRNSAPFWFVRQPQAPYLASASLRGNTRVVLNFSVPLDRQSAENPANYRIEPGTNILGCMLDPADPRSVLLEVSPLVPLGTENAHHIVYVSGLKSSDGVVVLPGRGDRLALLLAQPNLSRVFTYPNPFVLRAGASVTFANLTERATIFILTVDGRLLRTLEEKDGNGGLLWDGKDADGRLVGSGVYLYAVTNGKERVMGKLAVVR
ncbi:MAG: S8 family serine peptidase [candidate division KSB1 bacterium]|nr:S8 family serine peptidase [candidate division KSB1 bacterium]